MAHVYDLRSESEPSTARASRLLVLLLQIYEGAPRLRSRLLEPESLEQTIRDYRGITPFITGHYGEINSQLDDFLKQAS